MAEYGETLFRDITNHQIAGRAFRSVAELFARIEN